MSPGKDKLKVSVVSYLNSRPFIYGLRASDLPIDLQEDIPSVCAEKIIGGQADIGLVPVAVLPQLSSYNIISNYCIGADGPVQSVLLLSRVPLSEVKTILMDYQSRTSVLLCKVLAEKFWNISVQWKPATENFERGIEGTTAGIVIGDRALKLKDSFPYVYDLAGEWKKFTGMPFVFACWVSTRKLDQAFIHDFSLALKDGLSKIDLISKENNAGFPEEEVKHYLTHCINYDFDEKKKRAMESFLRMVKHEG